MVDILRLGGSLFIGNRSGSVVAVSQTQIFRHQRSGRLHPLVEFAPVNHIVLAARRHAVTFARHRGERRNLNLKIRIAAFGNLQIIIQRLGIVWSRKNAAPAGNDQQNRKNGTEQRNG